MGLGAKRIILVGLDSLQDGKRVTPSSDISSKNSLPGLPGLSLRLVLKDTQRLGLLCSQPLRSSSRGPAWAAGTRKDCQG